MSASWQPQSGLVSILVPLYNEDEYVGVILQRAATARLPGNLSREIIVVDDGSTDDSAAVVEEVASQHPGLITLLRSARNRGKGAAIRTAIQHARGEYCVIQDADLEYNPSDYMQLLQPLVDGVADAVFGSRFTVSGRRRVLYYWHTVANRCLTALCNIVADLNLTDVQTGYKAARTSLLRSIPIRSDRFGIEPELTIKLSKRGARLYEVPISYEGRTYEDGKKIGTGDAFEAVWIICRYAFTNDLYEDAGGEILDAFSAAPRFNKWMADTIRPFVGSRVLEIGAGMGNLTRQLARKRLRYVATDIDPEHLARLRCVLKHHTKLESAECDLSRREHFEPFAGTMDTVICLNVLEHIHDDLAGLRNISLALQPGGRAIILVPNGEDLFGSLDVALGHFRRYSSTSLRNRLEETGFEIEAILDFNRISRPGWFVTSRLLKRSRLARWQLGVFDKFVWLWRRADNVLPWGPTSIIAIARKTTIEMTGSHPQAPGKQTITA